MMRHFGLNEWVDFVRDVVDAQQKAAMQSHLESGCKNCQKVLHMWKRVHEISRRDSVYEPPESAVRSMKGLYAVHGPHKVNPRKPVMARLLFDSLRNGLPAGVRSVGAPVRQMLYSAGIYEVDVRFEPRYDSEKVSLTGQILTADRAESTVDGIPVTLLRRGKILAESVTNPFGEFRLECGLEGSFQLRFELAHGDGFYIPLIEPNSGIEGRARHGRSSPHKRTRKKV
jgi:hypothetical protein